MKYARDTILVIAPSAGGKTEILNIIREDVGNRGLPHVYKPLSDSHTILDRVEEDDKDNYGRGHYHTWTLDKRNGHVHRNYRDDPMLPFTLSGNAVAHKFIQDFFYNLRNVPQTGELRFAELSGGVNTNGYDEPASQTDLSFAMMNQLLRQGRFSKDGLSRVLAVIHPQTDDEVRFALNSSRNIPTDREIDQGTASWPLSQEAMNIFGVDDFYALEPLFFEMQIPHVYTVTNDGGTLLRGEIEYRLPAILRGWEGWSGGEGGRGRLKESE
mgnify:CR=1 FL=1